MNVPSLLRLEEHRALSKITLTGKVLDLGGDKNSEYLTYCQGTFTTTTVNLDPKTRPDLVYDLEKPIPLESDSYNWAVLFNVLEHIFEYRILLKESVRVVRPGGSLLVVVPFLFPVHASPNDFHRFSASTLRKELEQLGMSDIEIMPLGRGVFSARYLLLDRLLPKPLRILSFYTLRFVSYGLDKIFALGANSIGKKYDPADYALGYCVTAKK